MSLIGLGILHHNINHGGDIRERVLHVLDVMQGRLHLVLKLFVFFFLGNEVVCKDHLLGPLSRKSRQKRNFYVRLCVNH